MRLHWLRFRYQFGLGRTPDDLRYRARDCFVSASALLVFTLGLYILVFAAIESITNNTAPGVLAAVLSVPIDGVLTIPVAILGYAAIHQYVLSRRGRASGIVAVSGQCFRLISDQPLRYFALIGDAAELARWYCKPMEWESILRADGVSVVMEAIPATGYVARLDSIGPYRVDWPAPDDTLNGPFGTFAIIPPPEIKAYRSRVRSHAWGVAPRTALSAGITSVLSGIVGIGIAVWLLAELLMVGLPGIGILTLGTAVLIATAVLIFVNALFFGGIPFIVRGIRYIRVARRGFRQAGEPGLAVEGTVTTACLSLDGFRTGRFPDVYIELAIDDDTTLMFRVPGMLAHRVLVGNQVRVECNPATEVVTNVTLLEPDVSE